MVDDRSLAFGDVLAGRYVLQDLVSEGLGVKNWRATDQQLHRNVRVELLPADDPRAENFLAAAQASTIVTDHRFLPVLDLLSNEQGFHAIVREWARATPLHLLLAQAPLPNARAADLVAELAEAMAHAHSLGVHHRRLTPHQVLLKQSGAVRIVGLGVQTALAPPDQSVTSTEVDKYVAADVQGIGRVLYACLVGRWPGGHIDGLRPAPTEHGELMRPRQVRAGISRRLDAVCDRILSPERHPHDALTDAASIAAQLRAITGFQEAPLPTVARPSEDEGELLRLDPVVIPSGPPPGLAPPRRRPKALTAREPTWASELRRRIKSTTRGHRALVTLGIVLGFALVALLTSLILFENSKQQQIDPPSEPVRVLDIASAHDFDPQGSDGSEMPETAALAIDGDPQTGWVTDTYYGSPQLGGLKDGVGLILDLGTAHEIHEVRIRLRGSPTNASIRVASATANQLPTRLNQTTSHVSMNEAGEDIAMALGDPQFSRFVVVWLRSLPEVAPNTFRGEIVNVVIRGR
ncbi:MAG: hypothetical protein E6Q27_02590 [Aeromicrobium sp.]|nr:MAG: hypothetical protein E6Q27_02590 [Aeromicrobium sp.]